MKEKSITANEVEETIKALTPSEMGKKSWGNRVKKYGKKGALKILKDASLSRKKLSTPNA